MESEVKFVLREKEAKAFFLYAYFGILSEPHGELKETRYSACVKCAYRAYLDMCRTLNVKQDDLSFAKRYCKSIASKMINSHSVNEMKNNAYSIFYDDKDQLRATELEEFLSKSKRKVRNDKVFYYGQAQKWINMTIKYLWLIGLIDDSATEDLDVPVDRFILQEIPNEKKSSIPSVPWSVLEKDEYKRIKKVIDECSSSINQVPISWECDAWINKAATEASRDKRKGWLWEEKPE